MSNIKEAIAKAPSGRVSRTPIGKRNILNVRGKEPGYVYRIVNDTEGRIQSLMDRGYELVSGDDVKVGDKRVESTSSVGSAKSFSVGQGVKGYVMRIKQEFYDEDVTAKQREVDAIEATTRDEALNGTYGKLEITRKG